MENDLFYKLYGRLKRCTLCKKSIFVVCATVINFILTCQSSCFRKTIYQDRYDTVLAFFGRNGRIDFHFFRGFLAHL